MKILLKKIVHANIPLKACSLFLGYGFWYILASTHTVTEKITVPLCFYNLCDTITLDTQPTVTVHLQGKRCYLRSLNRETLAAHIDAHALPAGASVLSLTHAQLFLPEMIKLVHYEPTPISVNVKTTKE